MVYAQEKIKPYNQTEEKGRQVERMFDSIAHSYDFLNHLLSLGIDRQWRRTTIKALKPYRPQRILDVATGTGDFAVLAARILEPKEIVASDLSEGMMNVGRKKVEKAGLAQTITFRKEDCMALSFEDNSFDAVTVAYGVRNFPDLDQGLREMLRVLKPGGHLAILELCTPRRFPMKQLFWLYSHVVMPLVGKLVSKDARAYTYLPQTMEAFPQGEVMEGILKKAGFEDVRFKRFTFGLSTMYIAKKGQPLSPALPRGGGSVNSSSKNKQNETGLTAPSLGRAGGGAGRAEGLLLGLIGYPLGHSFSRKFFSEKFLREGIDAEYLNFEIPDARQLLDVVKDNPKLRGLNCTIPHKQAIIPLLDELHPDAAAIGAVNTVRIERNGSDIRLIGYNTDCIGFEQSLRPLLKPEHKRALVLGTGGASKAIVYVLRKLGIEPTYVSRTPKEGQLSYADLTPEIMDENKVIVNCSPVGMYPHIDAAPEIPYSQLGPEHLLYDLVYNPEETLFMKEGREMGAAVKNGQEMLERQALASWAYWNSNMP